jgi:hypothetical protein
MVVIPDLVDIQVPPAIPAMGNIPETEDTQATAGIQAKTTEDTQAIAVLQCTADTQATEGIRVKTREDIPSITVPQCTAGIPETEDTQAGGGIRKPIMVDTQGTAAIRVMACPPVTAVVTPDMRDTRATTVTPVTTVIQEICRVTIHGVADQGTLNLPMDTARTMAAVIQTRR